MLVKYNITNIAPSNAPPNQTKISYEFPVGTEDSVAPKDSNIPIITKIVNKSLPEDLNLNNKTKLANQKGM